MSLSDNIILTESDNIIPTDIKSNIVLLQELARLIIQLRDDNRDLRRENRRLNQNMNMVLEQKYDLARQVKSAIHFENMLHLLHKIS